MSKFFFLAIVGGILFASLPSKAQSGGPGGGGNPGNPPPPTLSPLSIIWLPTNGSTVTTENFTYINGVLHGQMSVISFHELVINGQPNQFVWVDVSLSNGVGTSQFVVAAPTIQVRLNQTGHYESEGALTGTGWIRLFQNHTAFAKTVMTYNPNPSVWQQHTANANFYFTAL